MKNKNRIIVNAGRKKSLDRLFVSTLLNDSITGNPPKWGSPLKTCQFLVVSTSRIMDHHAD